MADSSMARLTNSTTAVQLMVLYILALNLGLNAAYINYFIAVLIHIMELLNDFPKVNLVLKIS